MNNFAPVTTTDACMIIARIYVEFVICVKYASRVHNYIDLLSQS